MPRLKLNSLLSRLEERPPSAAVFLHGEEEYLREDALQRIVQIFLDPSTRDFNLDQVRGGDATPEGLGSLIATPPMMAEYRVVVVKDAQGLSAKAREAVEATLPTPPAGLILIISATIPSSSKARFYDTLQADALSVGFPALEALELPGWLLDQARNQHGVEMELAAARALSSAIGGQLGILATELEKAVSYVGDRKQITVEDIRAVGGYVPRVDRWGWFDKVGEKKFAEALSDLPELLDAGENGVGLVIGLASQLLKLGLLVGGGAEGLDRAIRPNQRWLIKRLQPQARLWTSQQIDSALADLLRTDRLLKSASMTDRQAIEELLLRLLGSVADSPAPSGSRRKAAASR